MQSKSTVWWTKLVRQKKPQHVKINDLLQISRFKMKTYNVNGLHAKLHYFTIINCRSLNLSSEIKLFIFVATDKIRDTEEGVEI